MAESGSEVGQLDIPTLTGKDGIMWVPWQGVRCGVEILTAHSCKLVSCKRSWEDGLEVKALHKPEYRTKIPETHMKGAHGILPIIPTLEDRDERPRASRLTRLVSTKSDPISE